MSETKEIRKGFEKAEELLSKGRFTIVEADRDRPWGGYFVIDDEQTEKFLEAFFPDLDTENMTGFARLSPKLLVVAPGKRLSWQYHNRRAEVWRVLEGKVGVVTSETDKEEPRKTAGQGDVLHIECGERHRLEGLEKWAVLAEIWQHTDVDHPSDESDIIRLSDDYGRD